MPQLSVLPSGASSIRSRRWLFFVLAAAAVLAAHALLLWSLGPSWVDPEEPAAAAPVLDVRSVTVAAPTPPATMQAPAVQAPPVMAPKATAKATRAPTAPKPAASAVSAIPPTPVVVVAEPVTVVEPAAVAPSSQPPAPAIDVPVYATRLPPPSTWRYELTRGIASGDAVLGWQPRDDQRYEIKLEGFIAGITVLDWVSSGGLDGAGIAPERFVIRRRGKDSQAANFQRDAGKITFSGPTHELPLIAGVQDRLSWMLQLPAIVEAAPQRFGAGSSVVLMVIGARGGADVWTFNVIGADRVGDVAALKLVREARKPRDVQVEVWLDPVRGHMPVRALLTQPDGGAPLELQLQAGSTGP